MGFEREEGDGANHPILAISSQAGSLIGSQRTSKPCFTSLVALEGKESGLITSTIPSLPTPAPGHSVLPAPLNCDLGVFSPPNKGHPLGPTELREAPRRGEAEGKVLNCHPSSPPAPLSTAGGVPGVGGRWGDHLRASLSGLLGLWQCQGPPLTPPHKRCQRLVT